LISSASFQVRLPDQYSPMRPLCAGGITLMMYVSARVVIV
jgi:hypothetical protein